MQFVQQLERGADVALVKDGDEQGLAARQQVHHDALVGVHQPGEHPVVQQAPPVICRVGEAGQKAFITQKPLGRGYGVS